MLQINNSSELQYFLDVLDLIGQSTDDYLYFYDLDKDYYAISERATRAFALKDSRFYNASSVLGNLFYPDDAEYVLKDIEQIHKGIRKEHNIEYRWLDKYGNPVWICCRGSVIQKEDHPAYLVGVITELGKQNRIDKITGLYNSGVLRDRITFMSEVGESLAGLMIIGIDNFKGINDWHGSSAGDEILYKTARFIECAINDAVGNAGQVFRLDGDLFAIFTMAPEITGNSDGFKKIYKDIRSRVDTYMEESSYRCFYTISAGSAIFNIASTTADNAIMRGKFALHCAKLAGKNNYVAYNEEVHNEYIKKLDIQEELRRSINNGFEGFEIYYQPIVNPATNTLYGAEALLRWNSSKYGFISPALTIPILESSGLIIPLGKWITLTAARQCAKWRETYPDFRMNINLSFVQLLKSDVLRDMVDKIDEVGVPHDNIVFEVTESGQLESNKYTRSVLGGFSDSNFKLAIDDFGTGYSNLRYVKDMMFGLIKIDRLFIQNIDENEYNYMLVKHVTDLAHSLNLKVCMEGVETSKELKTVMSLKPDCIQGYYYDKPLCRNDFECRYMHYNSLVKTVITDDL